MAALLLLAALVAAYHLGKESIGDEIVGNASQGNASRGASQATNPNVASIKHYDDNGMPIDTDAVNMAEPYEYKDVDPHDYVGKKVGMKAGTQVGVNKVTRKESD